MLKNIYGCLSWTDKLENMIVRQEFSCSVQKGTNWNSVIKILPYKITDRIWLWSKLDAEGKCF